MHFIVSCLINLILLLVVLVLGMLSFFALLELVLTFSAPIIVNSISSTVRQHYTLVTVRNLWLLGGGAILLGFSVACIHHVSSHLGERRSRRLLLRIILAEIVIIGLNLVLAA